MGHQQGFFRMVSLPVLLLLFVVLGALTALQSLDNPAKLLIGLLVSGIAGLALGVYRVVQRNRTVPNSAPSREH